MQHAGVDVLMDAPQQIGWQSYGNPQYGATNTIKMDLFEPGNDQGVVIPDRCCAVMRGAISAEIYDLDRRKYDQSVLLGLCDDMLRRQLAPVRVDHTKWDVGRWYAFGLDRVRPPGETISVPSCVGESAIFDTILGRRALKAMTTGNYGGLSIGCWLNIQTDNNGNPIYVPIEMWEISICEHPRNPLAHIGQVGDGENTHVWCLDNGNGDQTCMTDGNPLVGNDMRNPPTQQPPAAPMAVAAVPPCLPGRVKKILYG